ncbi:hypothetical protein [Sulfitobacter sp. SK012]|uniref:hypothetical protein n=1 Tax=Sulfitobacter sp. SK012 TaxID=1389005 RepID=UPI0013B3FFCF|nr:hypothetical protein [Sulfitobacter sp. SK012]
MNTAAAIIRHALRMLFKNPVKTLRVIAPALLLLICVGLVTYFKAPYLLTTGAARNDPTLWPADANVILSVSLTFFFVVGYALMAILWHRYALAETEPRPLSFGLLLGYLWRVVLLGIIQLAFSVAIMIPLLISAAFTPSQGIEPNTIAILVTTFLAQIVMIWLSLRLSLVLPAAALGRPLPIVDSWRETGPLMRPLWGVAGLLAAFNTLIAKAVELTSTGNALAALTMEMPIYLIQGLLIFGVLTTLYAHLQQDRPLA